ncbi:MAG: SPFH domain-containing protein, partial [Clostridia bacterium]|nr:SPFH domain-containing protein [Clostridia bacterium]
MGLIKAIGGAVGGALADQWKEFFYCDSIDSNTLMVKGQKRTSSRSSNTKGEDNIISNGSLIAVADGQAMMIVEQGKVVEFCAEPGEFTYDTSTEPSIFAGSLGSSILDTFKTIGKRFTFGGDTAKDQRVYYFNTKEILGNKYGTATPIPFEVVINEQMGLKLSVDIRCNGEYTYKLTNPLLFYTNIAGNVSDSYEKTEWEDILRSSLLDALQPAL